MNNHPSIPNTRPAPLNAIQRRVILGWQNKHHVERKNILESQKQLLGGKLYKDLDYQNKIEFSKLNLSLMQNYWSGYEMYCKYGNYDEAAREFYVALKMGYSKALKQSFRMKSDEQSKNWALDDLNAEKYFIMGIKYFLGLGVSADLEKSYAYMVRAEESGHNEARFMIGRALKYGRGISANVRKAVAWLQKASEAGHSGAQTLLGISYLRGSGINLDVPKALYWLTMAAQQAHLGAQYALGAVYLNGEGVEQNKDKALQWLRLAAEQGFCMAQYVLGIAYLNYQEIAQNKEKALQWLRLAAEQEPAEQGRNEAKNVLEQMYGNDLSVVNNVEQTAPSNSQSFFNGNHTFNRLIIPQFASGIEEPTPANTSFQNKRRLSSPHEMQPPPKRQQSIHAQTSATNMQTPSQSMSLTDYSPQSIYKDGGVISARYLGKENLPQSSTDKTQKFSPEGFSRCMFISASEAKGVENFRQWDIKENGLNFEYYSVHKTPVTKDERVTFICAARQEEAFLPQEREGGRLVLFLTEQERSFAQSQVKEYQDVIVMKGLQLAFAAYKRDLNADELKLIYGRRVAIFAVAHYLGLQHCVVLDDNIEALTRVQTDEETFEYADAYALVQAISAQGDRPCFVSVHGERFNVKVDAHRAPQHTAGLGSKFFYYPLDAIWKKLGAMGHLLEMLPPRLDVPGEDRFISFLLEAKGIPSVTVNRVSLQYTRSRASQNICRKTVCSAQEWRNFSEQQFYSVAAQRAFQRYLGLIEKSEQDYQQKRQKLEGTSIFDNFKRAENPVPICSADTLQADFVRALQDIVTNEEFYGLRPSQIEAIRNASQSRELKMLFKLPTGLGKTILFLRIINQLQQQNSYLAAKNIAIVACNLTLVRQIYATIDHYNAVMKKALDKAGIPEADQERFILNKTGFAKIGSHDTSQKRLIMGSDKNGAGKVYIICRESFSKFLKKAKEDTALASMFNCILFDEVHLMPKDLLQRVTVEEQQRYPKLILGFDATPGEKIRYFNNTPVIDIDLVRARQEGWLAPHIIMRFNHPYKSPDGHDNTSGIGKVTEALHLMLQHEIHPCGLRYSEVKTIIWTASRAKAKLLMDSLNAQGLAAKAVFSGSFEGYEPNEEEIIEQFDNNELTILIAVQKLKVGFDSAIDHMIFLKDIKNRDDAIQAIGRGVRSTPQNCCWDGWQMRTQNGMEKVATVWTFQDFQIDSLPDDTLIGYSDQAERFISPEFLATNNFYQDGVVCDKEDVSPVINHSLFPAHQFSEVTLQRPTGIQELSLCVQSYDPEDTIAYHLDEKEYIFLDSEDEVPGRVLNLQ